MPIPVTCWRCEKPGHVAADCQPPPATTRKELDTRIDNLKQRWFNGEITTTQKRTWIASEVRMFKPKEKTK